MSKKKKNYFRKRQKARPDDLGGQLLDAKFDWYSNNNQQACATLCYVAEAVTNQHDEKKEEHLDDEENGQQELLPCAEGWWERWKQTLNGENSSCGNYQG